MAKKEKDSFNASVISVILIVGFIAIASIVSAIFVFKNDAAFLMIGIAGLAIAIGAAILYFLIKRQREKLLVEILGQLHLEKIDSLVRKTDDIVTVKSRQTFDNYTDLKYFKDNNIFENVRSFSECRKEIRARLYAFLKKNEFENRPQYKSVKNQLINYYNMSDGYRIRIVYITPAGNTKGDKTLYLRSSRIDELASHPEYLMTKGEYNKLLKQQSKEELDAKKHSLYEKVNEIIDFANNSKETMIVKSQEKILDDLIQKLFDGTVNSIQKVSKIDSDAWIMIENLINKTNEEIHKIVKADKRISDYYASAKFDKIKETCQLLTQSQKEFNEYINEKAQAITRLFGTRVVRNETQNDDTYNYIRTYKKSITPFTAEVSSAVFGSAENNPIGYIIKYFYPNRSQYVEQIDKLRMLIEELETLKEAKDIIENYKKDYDQYIKDVPQYVLDNDEEGFYSRLGLAIIDESVLNVEYRFTYTSNGGMAQRSFSVPMNEDNIAELIYELENKLSANALAKEQRALMTTKLRTQIKKRDNYTCCQCGNSAHAEPNLLLEIDHIIPVSKGGLTREDNLQTLCWKCNRSKGAKISA